jgi:hypothetical protein
MMSSKYKTLIFVITFFVFIATEKLYSQEYTHSAGVRAGFSSGIVYKGFFDRNAAAGIEALYNRNGLNVSLLYEYHIAPFKNNRSLFYFGGGLFAGKWVDEFSLGVAGVVGFEYILRDIPLIFSADWKPLFNIIMQTDYELIDFGISIRYRFEI